MSDLTIPEEAIEAACRAINGDGVAADSSRRRWEHVATPALMAAAPLIVAAELERLADEFDRADSQVTHFRLADDLRLRADTIRGGR